jgi:phosphoglucosamine mutase
MRKLFGTDGIRARAHEYPLDPATMYALGRTLTRKFEQKGEASPQILLGRDTRESGPGIAHALAKGIEKEGGRAVHVGVIPTPGVAYLCTQTEAVAAISISASHNPYEDNGVKVFGHDGMKLPDEIELEIENELLALRDESAIVDGGGAGESTELIEQYERFLTEGSRGSLDGLHIVLDTGHGAAFRIAPEVFRRLGARVDVIHDAPNGSNINENAGALHPEGLAREVVARGAEIGVAFDGDADRAIFVDDRGKIRDGDEILFLWAKHLRAGGRLRGDLLVATVMSNFGFEKQLANDGIRLIRASVGDKYVLEQMIRNDSVLGGEQSGHVIDRLVHTTGDGIHTAIAMAGIVRASGRKFSELQTFQPMPQVLVNQKVASKPPLEGLDGYQKTLRDAEGRLGGRGRILVRYSGTENLVRVMVEGEDQRMIDSIARDLADVLSREIA